MRPLPSIFSLLLFCTTISFACHKADLTKEYETALRLYDNRDHEAAVLALEQILEQDPEFTNARIMLGKIHYFQKDFSAAVREFKQAHGTDPRSDNALFWLAKAQSLQEDTREAALRNLDLLLEHNSAHLEAWRIKGELHERRGEIREAIVAYSMAVSQSGEIARSAVRLGALYLQAGLDKKAEEHFAQARVLGVDNPAVEDQIRAARKHARSNQEHNIHKER